METLNIQIQQAVIKIKAGEVIAFPTETFFGLGVDPCNPKAVEKLLNLKERFLGEGVPLIASDLEVVNSLEIDDSNFQKRLKLQEKFWPGPLTIVVKIKNSKLSKDIFAKDNSVALRVSSHEISRMLAKNIGGLITSTSANPHGFPPARTVEDVKKYFPDMFVVDGKGNATSPSTIVSMLDNQYRVLREGAISSETLKPYL